MLTGHFDTVEIGSYGDLEPIARDPDRLLVELAATLAREPLDLRNALAIDDFKSGDFIPGRGLLDMKAGLAAALAVMEQAARSAERVGNLLFVAVPDEEANSAGARRVAEVLRVIAQDHKLSIEAAINLDAIADDGDGSQGQVVALGSVGKLLPSAFVVGQPVHASYSLQGISSAALAGAIAASIEWLPALTPRRGTEVGPAPTLLGMRDNKTTYDVTTPSSVWMYWNVALYRPGARELLETIAGAVQTAADALGAELSARRLALMSGVGEVARAEVITYDELRLESGLNGDRLDALAVELDRAGHDVPEQCRRLTEFVWQASGRQGPAIVLGFASTPYPPVGLGEDPAAQRLAAAVQVAIASVSAAGGTPIGTVRFFPGISDMSFLGQAEVDDMPAIAANTPAWPNMRWPENGGIAGIPIVNAGPWGRDYHTRLERAHRRYTFDVLPVLVREIAIRVLSD
jgi:arginine utilization protein RocB